MRTRPVLLGNELRLERIPVQVSPDEHYIQIGIRSFGKGIFHREKVPGAELGRLRYFEIKPGRLIVSNIMAWEGAIAVSAEQDLGCVGSNRFLSYVPSRNVDVTYLNYYFQSQQGREAIRGTSTGTVLRNQTLSIRDFENLVVPLPDLDEQRRIATRLNSALARLATMQEGRERATKVRNALHESVFQAEQTNRSVRLGDLLTLERNAVDVKPEREYVQIGIRSFGNGIFHRDKMPGSELSKLRYFEIQPGRLIVSNIMAWEGAIAISAEADRSCVGSSRFLSFNPSGNVSVRYLNHYFQSRQGRDLIRSTSTGTVLRNQTLSIKDFENLVIPLPGLDRQQQVASLLDKSTKLKALSHDQDSTTSRLRLALLNAAFSGQL